jgi:L-alanine-DL-glutamate epimerase-like enolase superfamily enzyme
MPRRIRLTRVALRYADGMVLHTATSGPVATLDELRLVVEQDGAIAAMGATRLNIAYLTGLDADALAQTCVAVARALPWAAPFASLVPALDRAHPDLPAPARMLFEMTAQDGCARARGCPLSVLLGGAVAARVPTNQTLFRADDETLLRRARAYVARGFVDLKLRVGFGAFADDLARLRLLRETFGPALSLSADANGAWPEPEAHANLRALAPLDLRYVEQPSPPGDWDATARVARAAPMPVMLDESLATAADVAMLARTRAAPLAHLKHAKLGGLDRLMQAGAALRAAGIGVMVGQMNEGAVSTLAAAHASAALGAALHELYGADGLADDPAGPLRYDDGVLCVPPGAGIGLGRHDTRDITLWEHTA